ncbi:MAG: MCP four helix bundle domain-containing protein [Myxococcaceae bacterium]|nr:MCP four helix bundle domain-containing protein [Myxococcaceae bacterium]
MSPQISIRGYRAGFVFVVALLASTAIFALVSERRTNERTNVLVQQALERAALIGRIRVDALSLESSVESHIRAEDDAVRKQAEDEMDESLEDIRLAVDDYTNGLPDGEKIIWAQFREKCEALAAQVRKARTFSNRREAARAQRALEQRIRPLSDEVDDLAAQLSQENADVTRSLLAQVEGLRLRSTQLGSAVAVLAVLVSLVVGWRMSRVIGAQERTIRSQLTELDRRNQELDAFASRVAHDLVSPLGPLRGYVTLLRRSAAAQEPSTRELLDNVDQSVRRATELVEALLRFCRAGRQGDAQVSELDTAIDSILLEIDQIAARDGVRLERHIEKGLHVAAPLQLLQSIAHNVLQNAVKYTAGRPDPKVVVRAFRDKTGGTVAMEVSDTGIGMNETTLRNLFQPFFRAPEARHLPGHGLGLATIRKIIDAYNGSIQLKSAPGVGTTVTVRFPLANPGGSR